MIKSRTAQLIFQTAYCTLGLVGSVASFGIFDDIKLLHLDFYVYFTNLSNFLCIGVMLAALIQTARKREDGPVSAVPLLKFIGMLCILLTFLIFNIMLAGAADRDPQLNWRVGSLSFHAVLPVMYIAHWFLFYERRKTRWFYPLVSTAFPLAYVGFLAIQAAVMRFDTSVMISGTHTPLIYPYPFLNLETQGILGVGKWILMLLAAFIAVGYLFLALDRIGRRRSR